MTRVLEVNSFERLHAYRAHWAWLLADTREATYFQTFDWLEAYLRHNADRLQLRVLLVSGSDGPIGIMPLVAITENTRFGSVRVLTYPTDGWGTFYGPIGPQPTATLTAALKHVAVTPRDWDLIDLRWVDADGVDQGRTRQALRSAELMASEELLIQAAQIELTGSWEAYWSSRPADWRREIERSRRRLGDNATLEYVRYRPLGAASGDGDPRWHLYDACEEIARRSWQGSSDDGTDVAGATPRCATFYAMPMQRRPQPAESI